MFLLAHRKGVIVEVLARFRDVSFTRIVRVLGVTRVIRVIRVIRVVRVTRVAWAGVGVVVLVFMRGFGVRRAHLPLQLRRDA